MLWQDADVGDVGTVAAEWGRHSTALTDFADALRSQREELQSNWQGRAADLAADRLAELSRPDLERRCPGGHGAEGGGRRRRRAGPRPEHHATAAAGPDDVGDERGRRRTAATAPGDARRRRAGVHRRRGGGRASKAEAVRVMQRYETSLQNSGHQVVPAQSDATRSRNYEVDGTTSAAAAPGGGSALGGGGSGGVPWSRLVGGGPPGAGGLVGAGPGAVQSVLAAESAALSDAAAKRAMGAGGFFPGMAAPHGGDDEDRPHRTQPAQRGRRDLQAGRASQCPGDRGRDGQGARH